MGPARTLVGRLVSGSGRRSTEGVSVWLAYRPCDGPAVTLEAVSDARGTFAFDLPSAALRSASVGAELEGVDPVDLAPGEAPLEAGDVVLVIDDLVPPHLRFGG